MSKEPQTLLLVRAGPRPSTMVTVPVNDDTYPCLIETPFAIVRLVIRIKNFNGITPNNEPPLPGDQYFEKDGRSRRFSIMWEIRFKHSWNGDDVYFGTDFDRKISIPKIFWAAVELAKAIDPSMEVDARSDKPSITSPMLCAVNAFNVRPAPIRHTFHHEDRKRGRKGPSTWDCENMYTSLEESSRNHTRGRLDSGYEDDHFASRHSSKPYRSSSRQSSEKRGDGGDHSEDHHARRESGRSTVEFDDAGLGFWNWSGGKDVPEDNYTLATEGMSTKQRRKFYLNKTNRRDMTFEPDMVYTCEFYSPYMDFNTFNFCLGVSVNVRRFLDGHPIRYTLRSKCGRVRFFCVEFSLVDTD